MPGFTRCARRKVFTKIRAILADSALGLWLAALIIQGRLVKIAIKANVK